MGKELISILYERNAKVYVAARSETKAMAAIHEVERSLPGSTGQLLFLHLDLSDLSTIEKSAQTFLERESRLDVLWNNAGVMMPAQGSVTTQGYELQMGVNALGSFLFTKFLHPTLAATARTAPRNSVRVVWVSSSAAVMAPSPAIDFDNMDYKKDESALNKYMRSKAAMVVHSSEFARRTAGEGILSIVSFCARLPVGELGGWKLIELAHSRALTPGHS